MSDGNGMNEFDRLKAQKEAILHRQTIIEDALWREKLAQWMIAHGLTTGHGDTFDDLLMELAWQIEELRHRTSEAKP